MDQDLNYDDDEWDLNDSETDELGLRIAAHAKRRQEELLRGDDGDHLPSRPRSPPSPMTLKLQEHRRKRAADREESNETRPREPFWRAKERYALDGNAATRPKPHTRAVSEGQPIPSPVPVNIPNTWGGRNRHRAHWLNRSTTEGEGIGLLESVKKVDEDTVLLHRPRFTGDDILVASGGNTPLHGRRRTLQFSSPNSLGNMNTTLQPEGDDGDDLDFNDESVIVSTPAAPPKTRNRKIDQLMKEEEREQQVLDLEKDTNIRQSRFSTRTTAGSDRPVSAPNGLIENRPFPRRRRRSPKGDSHANEHDEEADQIAVKFKERTNDTKDLLRRLARVSSLSPSPAPEKTARDYPDQRRKSKDDEIPEDVNGDGDGDTSHIPTVRLRPGRKNSSITNLFSKATAAQPEHSKDTSHNSRRINSEPLPFRAGSALETIIREGGKDMGDSTMASLEDIANPDVEDSSYVETKREEAVEVLEGDEDAETRRRREEKEFEDANRRLRVARTSIKDADRGLRRLENRLESGNDDVHRPEDDIEDLPKPKQPAPPAKNDEESTAQRRLREEQELQDANRKSRVSKASGTNLAKERRSEEPEPFLPTDLPENFKPYTNHNNRTLCRHCGGSYTSVWLGLWTEFREQFYTYTPTGQVVLTWPGWVFAWMFGWIAIEVAAGIVFQKWLWGARFPFVAVTLIYRVLREPREYARWAIDVGGNILLGRAVDSGEEGRRRVAESIISRVGTGRIDATERVRERIAGRVTTTARNDGDWVAAAAAATGAATRRVWGSAVEAVDEVGSMWGDEYLDL